MLSQKYAKKFDEERELSIELKKKLVAHLPLREVAQRLYEERCPRVAEIVKETLTIRECGGSSLKLSALTRDLRTSQAFRDRPLSEYNSTLKDILNTMERATSPFIYFKAADWENLKKGIPNMRVIEEISTTSFDGKKVVYVMDNSEAVQTFTEKLISAMRTLYDMKFNSIPEIETFIEETEGLLNDIDMAPKKIELPGWAHADVKEGMREEKSEPQSGYPTKDGVVLLEKGKKSTLAQMPAEKDKSLFDQASRLMDRFK